MNVANNPSVSDSDVNNSELLLHQRNVIVPATQRRNENNTKMTFADSALAGSILPQVRAARRRSNVVWAVIAFTAGALIGTLGHAAMAGVETCDTPLSRTTLELAVDQKIIACSALENNSLKKEMERLRTSCTTGDLTGSASKTATLTPSNDDLAPSASGSPMNPTMAGDIVDLLQHMAVDIHVTSMATTGIIGDDGDDEGLATVAQFIDGLRSINLDKLPMPSEQFRDELRSALHIFRDLVDLAFENNSCKNQKNDMEKENEHLRANIHAIIESICITSYTVLTLFVFADMYCAITFSILMVATQSFSVFISM
jgi:hypothetical protein